MPQIPDEKPQDARTTTFWTRRKKGIAGLTALAIAVVGGVLGTRDNNTPAAPTPPRTSSSSGPVAGETPSATPRPSSDAALPIALPAFEDDFEVEGNMGTLDDRFWKIYEYPSTKNTGGQWIEELVSVGGGTLNLQGDGKNVAALCFCGTGTPDYSYGDYTFRVRMDPGAGFVGNVMIWPGNNNWPVDGEVNGAEMVRADRQSAGIVNHFSKDGQPAQTDTTVAKDFTQWVDVRIEWRPDRITVLWDEEVVFETTENIPSNPMHPVIQLDIVPDGFGDPALDPETAKTLLQVDSVKFTPILGVSTIKEATGTMGVQLETNSPGRELFIQQR